MPDDFFRIRLVCTLLDTCGMCFDRGTAKKKLDFFLTFFQVSSNAGQLSNIAFTKHRLVLHLHERRNANGYRVHYTRYVFGN
jgi:hypothetical protein